MVTRERNTARSVGKKRRADILTKFLVKMKRSGYDARTIRKVLVAGMTGYVRMVEAEDAGQRKINRPRWEGAITRRYKKIGAKANWFRKSKKSGACKLPGPTSGKSGKAANRARGKDEESDVESILFVPHTPGGLLAKMMQEEEELFRKGTTMKRVKMIERGGTALIDILSRKNPWAREGCDRTDCLPCMGERGKGENCQQENVVYCISCQECTKNGKKAEYTGETSRTGYLRGKEHLEGLKEEKEDNPLWKHCEIEHSGEKVGFRMKIVKGHRSPLTRQIHEAVEIQYSKADIVMNSKGEWNGAKIPRVVIEVGKDILEEDEVDVTTTSRKKVIEKCQQVKSGWKVENMSKRKREKEEIGIAKRARKEASTTECGTAQPEHKGGSKSNVNITGCGATQLEGNREMPKTKKSECNQAIIIGRPECGTAQPGQSDTTQRVQRQPRLYECTGWKKEYGQAELITRPECGQAREKTGPGCGTTQPAECDIETKAIPNYESWKEEPTECGKPDRDTRPKCDQAEEMTRPECGKTQPADYGAKLDSPECGQAEIVETLGDTWEEKWLNQAAENFEFCYELVEEVLGAIPIGLGCGEIENGWRYRKTKMECTVCGSGLNLDLNNLCKALAVELGGEVRCDKSPDKPKSDDMKLEYLPLPKEAESRPRKRKTRTKASVNATRSKETEFGKIDKTDQDPSNFMKKKIQVKENKIRKKYVVKRKLHTWFEPKNRKIEEFFKPLRNTIEFDPKPNKTDWAGGGGREALSGLERGVGTGGNRTKKTKANNLSSVQVGLGDAGSH